ncbi:MAG: VWA domain-containing protein [Kineosporiaceae bacterium]
MNSQGKRNGRLRRRLAGLVTAVLVAAGVVAIAAPAQAATCTGSTTGNVRGKSVVYDQCVRSTVTRSGTTYTITVWYTEANSATNLAQCTAAENSVNRCEHALANADDANGDNVNAVGVATEMATALGFYLDRGLGFPAGGATDLSVLVGEDPRLGGVNWPRQIYVDDEQVDQNDVLAKRLLAFHEMMHLVQDVWDNGTGWQGWFGEGIARAIEDRVDTALDADTGHLFIPELNGLMSTESDRTATTTDTSYRSFLWWTWLFDQYRAAADTEPALGWTAIRDFYVKLGASTDQLQAVRSFVIGRGGNLDQDWLDYTLSLWSYKRSPSSARLTYVDSEIKSAGAQLSGNQVITGGPAFSATQATPTVNSRSVKFYEFNPANQCDYASFSFDGNGRTFGFSVLTANASGVLVNRWSSISSSWTRTVRTSGLGRIVVAVTGLDQTGPVAVGWGCVQPTVTITRPTTAAFEIVGLPSAPRRFIAQVKVTGPSGEAIAGLQPSAFSVGVIKPTGGTPMPATVVQGAYVQDTYWLLVQAPNAAAGAVAGGFHDLRVGLGTISDTKPDSLLYADRSVDSLTVLDRSGSMLDSDKISAAKNAATLLNDALATNDQGGYVSFSTDATLDRSLAPMSAAQRAAIAGSVNSAVASGSTSIGDGMQAAASDHDAHRDPTHACGFTLLSDGYENTPAYWSSVQASVADNGCPVHAIALGPEANEPLLQQISAAVPGGSYDYADVGGSVPVGTSGTGTGASSGSGGGGTGGSPGAVETLDWANNLSRLYDGKAARLAGRQRLATFVGEGDEGCRTVDATVGFEGQRPGSSVAGGDAFADNGVKVKVEDLGTAAGGAAVFGTDRAASGAGTEARLRAAGLVFGFKPGCQVQFRFAQGGGVVGLYVNGERVSADLFVALDGQVVNGVRVQVHPDGGQKARTSGTVVLTGDLREVGVWGEDLAVDEVVHRTEGKGRTFVVDPTTRRLVTTVGWQTPDASRDVVLVDPTGAVVPASARRPGSTNRNEVWTVDDPKPGEWTVLVEGLDQPFFVTETAITDVALRLVVGAPKGDATVGASVPIAAFFSGPNGAVKWAPVWATVTDPQRRSRLIRLLDDGAHGDGEANDGVYGGAYTTTGDGDLGPGESPREGESSPAVAGSYSVSVVGVSGKDRREDSGSFALTRSTDLDQDSVSDTWEKLHGMDPRNNKDALDDPDGDGLPQVCEYRLGTDPDVDDSDNGGEVDGSEATWDGRRCVATTDPANGTDDRIGGLLAVGADATAVRGVAKVQVRWTSPTKGTLVSVSVQRRAGTTGAFTTLATGRTGKGWTDSGVTSGSTYQYRVVPLVRDASGANRVGRALLTAPVTARNDPYAPYGSVIVNNGAATTASTAVTLSLIAEDAEGEGDVGGAARFMGTPTASLQLRVSNRPDFSGASWQAFARSLPWTLPATPGTATVYVQFRDAAGNVSAMEGSTTDSIVYRP